jgi:uncharacterized protein YgiB involved in biofilm formation
MARRSSNRIRLGAYASPAMNGAVLAAAAASLAGCDAEPSYVPEPTAAYEQTLSGGDEAPAAEVMAYKTVADCVASGNDQSVCTAAMTDAKRSAGDFAPRYESKADCEKDFDKCETSEQPNAAIGGSQASHSSGGSFQPFLNGFLISQALNSFGERAGYSRHAPIFRGRDGSLVNGSGFGIPNYGSSYPAGRAASDGLTNRPPVIQRMGLGQSQTSLRGAVPGSQTDVVKSFRNSPSYQTAKASGGFRSPSSFGGGSRASSSSISRGGFGSVGRGSFGG